MHSGHHGEPVPIDDASLREGWEHRDLRARLVIFMMTGIGVMMFGACIVIVFVISGFDRGMKVNSTIEPSSLDTANFFIEGYDGVRNEINPRKDRDEYIAKLKHERDTYGKLSDQPGMERAHIPVEEAMKHIADKAVPYKREPQTALVN